MQWNIRFQMQFHIFGEEMLFVPAKIRENVHLRTKKCVQITCTQDTHFFSFSTRGFIGIRLQLKRSFAESSCYQLPGVSWLFSCIIIRISFFYSGQIANSVLSKVTIKSQFVYPIRCHPPSASLSIPVFLPWIPFKDTKRWTTVPISEALVFSFLIKRTNDWQKEKKRKWKQKTIFVENEPERENNEKNWRREKELYKIESLVSTKEKRWKSYSMGQMYFKMIATRIIRSIWR